MLFVQVPMEMKVWWREEGRFEAEKQKLISCSDVIIYFVIYLFQGQRVRAKSEIYISFSLFSLLFFT